MSGRPPETTHNLTSGLNARVWKAPASPFIMVTSQTIKQRCFRAWHIFA